ncbi:hypothetical protein F53441_12994 [Fusarium austroafricanum]|uniref:Uncharacterized protein n=1 Tax=Fusarium austroafricanum TaxID=2364996 RepID=A0A8H4JU95_9HYPO|nr:hypothetical protein F53441_12994 [Fusarium austroafricanum]
MPSPPTEKDVQSRLGVRLGDNESQYDEIVAFTQQAINKNFEALVDLYPILKKITFDDSFVGSIEANILAPQVIIPTDNSSKINDVLFHIRFKTGRFRSPNGLVELQMNGWVLTVECSLGTKEVTGVGEAGKPKSTDVTEQVFAVPGDYTAERLFAQISKAAKWGNPLEKYSTFGYNPKTKQARTYKEWSDEFDPAGGASAVLNSIMSNWAKKQEDRGRTTLGVTFKLKDPTQINRETPLYTPTYLFQQIHPYKDPVHAEQQMELERNKPLEADTSLNCLLYCEMVDNNENEEKRKLKTLSLAHNGNFVTRGTTIVGGDDQIDGVFALSYKHFLEGYLLPRLQPLNQATDIYVHPVTWKYDNSGQANHKVDWQYSVGLDPEFPRSNHAKFNFNRHPEKHASDNEVAFYKFTKTNFKNDNGHKFDDTSYHKYTHQSDASVTVTWENGKDTFYIKGETNYVYDSKWSSSGNFSDQSTITGKLRLDYKITWNFDIKLASATNGVLDIVVNKNYNGDDIANLSVQFKKGEQAGVTTPDKQENKIADEFRAKLKASLDLCVENLRTGMMNSGKFVYPGNGTFMFLNPCINRHGNVLTELEYLPLKKGELIQVPKPEEAPIPKIGKPPHNPVTVGSGVVAPTQKMTWSTVQTNPVSNVIKAKTTAEIKIIATNKTENDQYFGYFQIIFKSGAGKGNFLAASSGQIAKPQAKVQSDDPDKEAKSPTTVELEVSAGVTNVFKNLQLIQLGQVEGTEIVLWSATINATKENAIIVPPGGYIALKFNAKTGDEGTYTHTVFESFRSEIDPTEPPEDDAINSGNCDSEVVLEPNPEAENERNNIE